MRNFNSGDSDNGYTPKNDGDFNREDSRDSNLNQFAKDKRKRTTVVRSSEPVSRNYGEHRGLPRERRDYTAGDSERRSYNPNFTRDNRPVNRGGYNKPRNAFAERPYGYRKDADYEDSKFNRYDYDAERDDRPAPRRFDAAGSTSKPYGRNNSYGDRQRDNGYDGGQRRSYGARNYGEGNRPAAPRTQNRDNGGYGRSEGYDKPRYEKTEGYGRKEGYGKPSYGRPEGGQRRSFDGSDRFKGRTTQGKYSAKGRTQEKQTPRSYPRFTEKQEGEVRLNRYIAMSGLCSRREADTYITAGLVTVNGQVVTELGTKVLPTDVVKFNDSVVKGEQKVYLLMNKPKGYVTTIEDPNADKTVMDLIKGACAERIYPVGRLDKNSVGVLLFTNDGDLTKRLTHPSFNKKKVYQVTLDKALTKADMEQIAEGITLEDGDIFADAIEYASESKKEVGIEIHSGRNRIVRRIFEHLGYKVMKLDRVYFAGLTKKNLKRGGWRFLSPIEVSRLKSGEFE